MHYGFDVYTHESGAQLGMSRSNSNLVVAKITADGKFEMENHPFTAVAQTVAKLARRGFKKANRVMYLNVTYTEDGQPKAASFTKNNPDLWDEQLGDLLVFVNKPQNMDEDVFAQWREQLEKLTPSWQHGENWLRKQEKAASCLAAFDQHPVMVLLIAQYAFNAGLPMVSTAKGLPKVPPDGNILAWLEFLKGKFTEQQIRTCTEDLGLTVHQQIEKSMQVEPVAVSNDANSWFQTMQNAVF